MSLPRDSEGAEPWGGAGGGSRRDGRSGERLKSGPNLFPDHRPDAALRHRDSGLGWSCVGLRVAHCPSLGSCGNRLAACSVSGQRRNDLTLDCYLANIIYIVQLDS